MGATSTTRSLLALLLIASILMSTVQGYRAKKRAADADETAADADTAAVGEYSYLGGLTEDDLRQMLKERHIRVDGFTSREELLRKVIQSEKKLASSGTADVNKQRTLKGLLCVG